MQVLFNIAHSTLTVGNTAPPEMYCACGFVIEHDDWKCFPHIIHLITLMCYCTFWCKIM